MTTDELQRLEDRARIIDNNSLAVPVLDLISEVRRLCAVSRAIAGASGVLLADLKRTGTPGVVGRNADDLEQALAVYRAGEAGKDGGGG